MPPAQPKTVYLDMNHWIYLAKAAKGLTSGSQYAPALMACRAAHNAGDAVFVLSASHYMEMTKIKDPAQRRDLAALMEELSDFTTLLDKHTVAKLEVEALLDDRLGPAEHTVADHHLLGTGIGHAIGRHMRFTMRHREDGSDASEQGRRELGAEAFDKLMAEINLLAERKTLSGPEDADIPDLLKYGYNADVAEEGAQRRAEQENGQAQRHAGTDWDRGDKLVDVIQVREITIELFEILEDALRLRGITDVGVLADTKQAFRSLVPAMPTALVSTTLKIEQHRNPARPWSSNDIFDIDALSLAVPYCDIVVTDKGRFHQLTVTKLHKHMNTTVLRRLSDLPSFL
jgi:hypothetical protein